MGVTIQERLREKEILRIALDKNATQSLAAMADKVKAANPYVKIQPSQFVSFLVSDFFATYFEKDLGVLVAEFFDSESYCDAEAGKAKGKPDYEVALAAAASHARRIKAERRGVLLKKKQSKLRSADGALHEEV